MFDALFCLAVMLCYCVFVCLGSRHSRRRDMSDEGIEMVEVTAIPMRSSDVCVNKIVITNEDEVF